MNDDKDPLEALDEALQGFVTAIAMIGSAAVIGFMIAALSGCGVHVTPDPLTVLPIEVTHKFGLSSKALQEFFEEECQAEPDPETCVNEGLSEFYRALAAGSQ